MIRSITEYDGNGKFFRRSTDPLPTAVEPGSASPPLHAAWSVILDKDGRVVDRVISPRPDDPDPDMALLAPG